MGININKGKALEALNITPLIDVVFLLLIFFLVATRFDEEERELSVVLPQASEAKPLTEKPKEVFINIDREGRYKVNREWVDEVQLLKTLEQAWIDNPGRATVVIRADRRVPFQFVATAMNLCNKANIRDYRVAIDGEE